MPQISALEFERLPLRVHTFLAGVPLHDVWAVDLPRIRPGITLDEFLRTGGARPYRLSLVVRALLSIRLCIGWLLGLDREPTPTTWESFSKRLTTAEHSKALASGRHARRTFPGRIPLRKRAALRGNQPHRSCRGAECPRRNGQYVPILFRCLRVQC